MHRDIKENGRMQKEEKSRKSAWPVAGIQAEGKRKNEEGRNQNKINTTSVAGVRVGRNVDGKSEAPIVTRWPDYADPEVAALGRSFTETRIFKWIGRGLAAGALY